VRTRAWMGRSLLATGAPEAHQVLDEAAAAAQDLGMQQVAREIEELRR
jgi:hypothetical protein